MTVAKSSRRWFMLLTGNCRLAVVSGKAAMAQQAVAAKAYKKPVMSMQSFQGSNITYLPIVKIQVKNEY